MAIASRRAAVVPNRANSGCVTCKWVEKLPPNDQRAFHDWLDEGRSLTQLWDIISTDPDNPLTVSITALRNHVRSHRVADES